MSKWTPGALRRRSWTSEEEGKLCLMRGAGMTFEECAARLPDRSPGGCQARWMMLSPQRRNRPINLADLDKLLAEPVLSIDGTPVNFAISSEPCARCGVREDVHRQNGCGNFATELRVREG